MTIFADRLKAIEQARACFVEGAFACNEPPYTMEKVATALLMASIALVKLAECDHEEKARDAAVDAIRWERDRRKREALNPPFEGEDR